MLKSEPNDSFLNYALALEYIKTNELDKAIDQLQATLENDTEYLAAYYQLGQCFELKKDFDKAIVAYQNGVPIARSQNNTKTLSELNQAIMLLEDED